MQAGAGETITFSATASADYAVHSWTGVKVSHPTGTTATLTVTGDATVTVKFYETTFDGSSHSAEAWKKLKELIAAAPAGGTLKISGTIKATTAPGNSGEIIIDKDLTIEAPSVTATLDANSNHSGPPPADAPATKHRIFHVKDGKTLTLKNLTLKKGAVENGVVGSLGTTGGGIRIENGTVLLSDVIISDCKAITAGRYNAQGEYEGFHGNGAGIYVESGTIIMENTTLSENDANAYGGAVYLKGGTLTMKGSTVVTPSTGSDANKTGKNDVRLVEGAKIIVNGALTGSVPVARITVAYNEYLPTRQVLDGRAVDSNNTKFTVTDQELGTDHSHVRKWKINSDGYLQSEGVTLDGSKTRAWQALKDAVRTASDGDVIAINGTIQATNLGTGEYVDNGEIVIDKDLTIKRADGATSAILNANCNYSGSPPADAPATKHRIFKVDGATARLTLQDLTLKGGSAHGTGAAGWGGVIYTNGGSVTIKDCTLTENHADYHGGCVYAERGTVVITGSTFTGNNASHHGGAVYTADGSTSMTDCAFTANTVSSGGGGAVWIKSGSVSMARSSFTGNKGSSNDDIGGAVRITGGTVEITACTFTGNEAFSGGAIGVKGDAGTRTSVTISGGVIGGTDATDANKATGTSSSEGMGGGIYAGEGCALTLKDSAQVVGNTAKNGGGVYVKGTGATLTMSGGKISGNKAVTDPSAPSEQQGGAGGGIFIYTSAKLTISGSTVVGGSSDAEGNSAAIGGGIYMMDNGAKAEMTGGSITHNKADKSGGGVYISDYNSNPRSLFTLNGGTVSYNTAKNGGGITAFGDFNMDGGIIEKNTATGDPDPSLNLGTGGGIDLVAATMNITGGEIRKNHAKRGGGVSIGLSGATGSQHERKV